jgi:hypothetical protein
LRWVKVEVGHFVILFGIRRGRLRCPDPIPVDAKIRVGVVATLCHVDRCGIASCMCGRLSGAIAEAMVGKSYAVPASIASRRRTGVV